jgi:hypothetical protein
MSPMLRAALSAVVLAGATAHAAGPLGLCNQAPLKYAGAGSVTLNYDGGGGGLGTRTKSQADALVAAAAAKWNNVASATIAIGRGPDVPVNITASNYSGYLNSSSDGLNPVIYDTDGTIIDALFGAGNRNSVLGFAGSSWYGSPTCRYAEGRAVINGYINVSEAVLSNVVAHELGHLIGLDHSQLDSSQGLAASNYPLMYPTAYRSLSTLHDDDVSSVTALYPESNVAATFGTLTGNLRTTGGTAVRGANIWARDVSNASRVYSVVSDFLTQGTGYFRMLVPPGTYTLHAEAVAADHFSGSSVGPYADSSGGLSFQAPLYSGGSPMPALTFGNASPVQVTITAGCTANVDFRMNGTGSVGGDCTAAPPPTTPVPPTTPTTPVAGRLANLSTRMQVLTGNDVMITGFVISGTTPKTVAIVGTGPSLAAYGIANPLPNPSLTLVRSSDQAIIATNDDWPSGAGAVAMAASGFAPTNPLEAGLHVTLPPGAYTAILSGVGSATGIGVAAVYEVDRPESPLANISTRGQVRSGNDVMIGGFVIQGTQPQTVAIVGTGPSLSAYGIANPLPNPTITLVRTSDQAVIATNDNWSGATNAAQIQVSGFAPSNPLESALLVTLQPGAYTAIMSGVGGTTGTGIVAVYAVP